MSRKLSIKLILAGLWLMCYFPYKEALLIGEDSKVSSLLGDIQVSEVARVFDMNQQDLTDLDRDDIHSFSWIKFDAADPEDMQFNDGLAKLDLAGHDMLYDDDCFCKISSLLSLQHYSRQLEASSVQFLAAHGGESDFGQLRYGHFTKNPFWSLSR